MWIQLNIVSNGSSARIYARAKHGETGYTIGSEEWRGVFIWHTDTGPAMHKLRKHQIDNHENDLFVSFKSRVPFANFCERFAQSTFNDPDCYQMVRHNCAHGALFALRLADIPLKMPFYFSGKIARQTWLPVPFLLTPMALYRMAEAHKIQCIQAQAPNSHPLVKAKRAFEARLGFFSPERVAALRPVLDATRNSLKHHPAQPEFYLKALECSLDVAAFPEQLPRYRLLADRYRFRDASRCDKEAYHLMQVSELYFLSMVLLSVAGMISFTLIFILTMSAGSYMALRLGFDAPTDKHKRPLLPAPLSEAMVQLADTLAQEAAATAQTAKTFQ